MKDLGPRLAVSLVGIPAVLGLLWAGGWVLGIPLALLALLGAGEAYRFAQTQGAQPCAWLGMPVAATLVLVPVLHQDYAEAAPVWLGLIALLGCAALTLALWTHGPKGRPLASVSVTVFGAAYAGLPVGAIVLLHALPSRMEWGGVTPSHWVGAMIVALPLTATWVGDAAAYFMGSAFGRKKLFPGISPGKSWVGAFAGVTGAALGVAGWYLIGRDALPGMPIGGVGAFAGFGAALGVAAILGDLVESLLKREAGMKDSGRLLPGHGGVLDRLDALIYTVPLAYVVLRVAESLL